MWFWNALKIENCAAQQVHSQGLCFMWIHVETTFEHQRALEKETERAMILQEINYRHSSFLTVNQETNTSMLPGWATWTIFLVARGQVLRLKSTALSLCPPLRSRLTFPSFTDAVSFFLFLQSNLTCKWFEVAANKNHTIFRDGHGIREILKNKAILDSQEKNERKAQPNLWCWLTTSTRVKSQLNSVKSHK